jgi:hypothetical protein
MIERGNRKLFAFRFSLIWTYLVILTLLIAGKPIDFFGLSMLIGVPLSIFTGTNLLTHITTAKHNDKA